MNQDRLYSLDMMKFVAAIFITNSHFQPLYEGGILPLLLSGCRAIMLITNKWNSVFPLNIVIVFAIICLAAYLLKVMTAAFLSLLSKDKFALEV